MKVWSWITIYKIKDRQTCRQHLKSEEECQIKCVTADQKDDRSLAPSSYCSRRRWRRVSRNLHFYSVASLEGLRLALLPWFYFLQQPKCLSGDEYTFLRRARSTMSVSGGWVWSPITWITMMSGFSILRSKMFVEMLTVHRGRRQQRQRKQSCRIRCHVRVTKPLMDQNFPPSFASHQRWHHAVTFLNKWWM